MYQIQSRDEKHNLLIIRNISIVVFLIRFWFIFNHNDLTKMNTTKDAIKLDLYYYFLTSVSIYRPYMLAPQQPPLSIACHAEGNEHWAVIISLWAPYWLPSRTNPRRPIIRLFSLKSRPHRDSSFSLARSPCGPVQPFLRSPLSSPSAALPRWPGESLWRWLRRPKSAPLVCANPTLCRTCGR